MTVRDDLLARLALVTQELGELVDDVTLVGGMSPAVYAMNQAVSLRATADVDVILASKTLYDWQRFSNELHKRQFRTPPDAPICRHKKGSLVVDVMPADASQLGFGNRWYQAAVNARIATVVPRLHVVTPLYFVATKLDALQGRVGPEGQVIPVWMSPDLEDILVVIRGLPELLDEIRVGVEDVHAEVRRQLREIFSGPDAVDLVRAMLEGDAATQATAPALLAALRRSSGA